MYLLILLNIALKKEYLGKFFTLDLKVGHCGVKGHFTKVYSIKGCEPQNFPGILQ